MTGDVRKYLHELILFAASWPMLASDLQGFFPSCLVFWSCSSPWLVQPGRSPTPSRQNEPKPGRCGGGYGQDGFCVRGFSEFSGGSWQLSCPSGSGTAPGALSPPHPAAVPGWPRRPRRCLCHCRGQFHAVTLRDRLAPSHQGHGEGESIISPAMRSHGAYICILKLFFLRSEGVPGSCVLLSLSDNTS